MLDPIREFLDGRKELWLKNKSKNVTDETELAELHQEALEKYSLPVWLADAAKRAGQLSIVSHPSKFVHPFAKSSPIIAKKSPAKDGYLRSGNMDYRLDVFGNAAAMDTYKFLSILLEDNKTILEHLERNSELIKASFKLKTQDYDTIRSGFLQIKATVGEPTTDERIKQVYFPVDKDYHLLSIMTPSGVQSLLKQRIDNLRFSQEAKEAREARKKALPTDTGYKDIYGLTVTSYGGTQPQNISVLNSENAGRAYLLNSQPPKMDKRSTRKPKRDFFAECLNPFEFQDLFDQIYHLAKQNYSNIRIQAGIDNRLAFIIDTILARALMIRAQPCGWSTEKAFASLPKTQKIWLDSQYNGQREDIEEWLTEIILAMSRWLKVAYERVVKSNNLILSSEDTRYFRQRIEEKITQEKEFFR